jgi:peptidyl-prolyl cis-trans isomerase-like protein 2
MGKEKLYISASEWSNRAEGSSGGLRFGGNDGSIKETHRNLPFYCCALSLQPFEVPMAAISKDSAHIFDLTNIVPWIRKYSKNPITGESLKTSDLLKLQFARNSKGDCMDPVTFKVFNENTHIVFIRQTGNVYSMDTLQELCFKAKNLKDLLTDEPFTRKDVICIQDPHNLASRDMNQFYYLKNNLKADDEKDATVLRNADGQTSRILKQLSKSDKSPPEQPEEVKDTEMHTSKSSSSAKRSIEAAHFSTGRTAASFTSTSVMNPVTKTENFMYGREDVMFEAISRKGQDKKVNIQLQTNLGPLDLELFASITPKTVYNFLQLTQTGYYDNLKVHRLIAGFMMQTGDPTGTGKGGESCWGKDFEDEIKKSLIHDQRGLLSMANRGRGTNSSQFFITFAGCPHLDGKHTIFGKVVGGLENLSKMEQIHTDKTDRPLKDIVIQSAKLVGPDPFAEWQAAQEKEAPAPKKKPVATSTEVGRYLKRDAGETVQSAAPKKPKSGGGFNFDNW